MECRGEFAAAACKQSLTLSESTTCDGLCLASHLFPRKGGALGLVQEFISGEALVESGYSPEEVQGAMRFVANPPMQAWMLDVAAACEAIADVGKIAVAGFCLGGTLSYGAATNLPGFSVAVGYYGGYIVRMADQSPKVPTMLHFGELDTHIPMSDVETIKLKQPSVEVYTYYADHGFQCDERDSFAPEAAQIAWGRTLRFIDSHM